MQTADCLTADSGTGLPHPTLRLTLRTWAEADKIPFRIQNADPRVWEHFPIDALSAAESDAAVDRFCAHQLTHGFCFWATEISESKQFIGYVGLNIYSWTVDRAPVVEIGWRLAHEQWSKGFATEAARSVLEFAFCEMRAPEIVAITAATNVAVPENHAAPWHAAFSNRRFSSPRSSDESSAVAPCHVPSFEGRLERQ